MALIDLAKPYIWVVGITFFEENSTVEVTFKVNGCIQITEVSALLDGERKVLATSDDEHVCNYLNSRDRRQHIYSVIVDATQTLILEAIVDQEMGKSVQPEIVQPSELVGKPQTHFAKLRLEEEYHIEHNGHHINSSKRIQQDVTDRVKQIFNENLPADLQQVSSTLLDVETKE